MDIPRLLKKVVKFLMQKSSKNGCRKVFFFEIQKLILYCYRALKKIIQKESLLEAGLIRHLWPPLRRHLKHEPHLLSSPLVSYLPQWRINVCALRVCARACVRLKILVRDITSFSWPGYLALTHKFKLLGDDPQKMFLYELS